MAAKEPNLEAQLRQAALLAEMAADGAFLLNRDLVLFNAWMVKDSPLSEWPGIKGALQYILYKAKTGSEMFMSQNEVMLGLMEIEAGKNIPDTLVMRSLWLSWQSTNGNNP